MSTEKEILAKEYTDNILRNYPNSYQPNKMLLDSHISQAFKRGWEFCARVEAKKKKNIVNDEVTEKETEKNLEQKMEWYSVKKNPDILSLIPPTAPLLVETQGSAYKIAYYMKQRFITFDGTVKKVLPGVVRFQFLKDICKVKILQRRKRSGLK